MNIISTERFAQVTNQFGDQIFQIDTFQPSILYKLSAPSSPDEQADEALARVVSGVR